MKRAMQLQSMTANLQGRCSICYGIQIVKNFKKSVLNQRIETMKEQGILFENNTEVDAVLAKQLKATADAVVIAVGAGETRTGD